MNHFEDTIRLVRELKGVSFPILFLVSISPTPVSNRWLEIHSGYSDKPVAKALCYLQERGFIIRTYAGWVLANGVRQLPVNYDLEVETRLDPPPAKPSQEEVSLQTDEEMEAACQPDPVPENGHHAENSCPLSPGRKISDPLINTDIKNIDESKLFNNSNNTHPPERAFSEPPAERAFTVETRTYIQSSEGLQLEDVVAREMVQRPRKTQKDADTSPNDPLVVAGALAAVGIVLNDRTRRLLGRITTNDIDGVYRHLSRRGKATETGLLIHILEKVADPEHPQLEFPEDLMRFRCYSENEPEELDLEEVQASEALAVEMAFDGPPEIERAWKTALGLVKAELPQNAFDTWLAFARPLAWEAETAVLRVGVANSFARDWLEVRVKYLILPYLAGVLNTRVVSVEFVVV